VARLCRIGQLVITGSPAFAGDDSGGLLPDPFGISQASALESTIDPFILAGDLIRCRSVTPERRRAQFAAEGLTCMRKHSIISR